MPWALDGDKLTTTFEPGWTGAIIIMDLPTIAANGWDMHTDLVAWELRREDSHHTHGLASSVRAAQTDAIDAWRQMRVADPIGAR